MAVAGIFLVLRRPHPAFIPARAHLIANGSYIGVYERSAPLSFTPYAAFGRAVIKPKIALYYSGWTEGFQKRFASEAWNAGAITLVQMEPKGISLKDITAGHWDGYLTKYANEVRQFGHPVIIGFGHEMNGDWYPWGYLHQSSTSFIFAWRHIVKLFRQRGADNVTWMWTISSSGVKKGPSIFSYWPGSAYVDWVGIDGYYRNSDQNFRFVYSHAINQVRQITGKPILLSEVGIGKSVGQQREIPSLFSGIQKNHLLGLVWFDVDKSSSGSPYHLNWRLEGNSAAITAFRVGVKSLASLRYPSAFPSPSRARLSKA